MPRETRQRHGRYCDCIPTEDQARQLMEQFRDEARADGLEDVQLQVWAERNIYESGVETFSVYVTGWKTEPPV